MHFAVATPQVPTSIVIEPWASPPDSPSHWRVTEPTTLPVAFYAVLLNGAGAYSPESAEATPWVFWNGRMIAASTLGALTDLVVG